MKKKFVIPKELQAVLKAVRGTEVGVSGLEKSALFPISAEAKKRKSTVNRLANVRPGDLVAKEGIFIGQWAPKDRAGYSLGRIFNVFAARHDLDDAAGAPATFNYLEALNRISELKKWNGYDGANYADDGEIYSALKEGSYNGEWFIPTMDLLMGCDVFGGALIQKNNIYALHNKDAFVDTLHIRRSEKLNGNSSSYWSSTVRPGSYDLMMFLNFRSEKADWDMKDNLRMSCRPVRAVEVK